MPLFYHIERLHAPHNVRMSPIYVIKNRSYKPRKFYMLDGEFLGMNDYVLIRF
jgi:hypothetical protein